MTRLPRFYPWGGWDGRSGPWAFGWLTGKDNDLVCIRNHVTDEVGEPACSITLLSPICSSRILSFCAFVMKVLLVRIDTNIHCWLRG